MFLSVIVKGMFFVVAVTVIWLDIPFDILIQIAGFLLANFGIALFMPAAVYLNFQLPAPYRTRSTVLVGAIASALVLFGKLAGAG